LDCRQYALALAEYLGLSSITPSEWAALAKERGGPDVAALPLFAGAHPASPQPAPQDGWAAWEEVNKGAGVGRGYSVSRLDAVLAQFRDPDR
jgi:hypothetical protein